MDFPDFALMRRRLQVVAYLSLCELRELGDEPPECRAARLALQRKTAHSAQLPAQAPAEVRHLNLVGGES